jgi:cell wall-associated NlpC family hydrolase
MAAGIRRSRASGGLRWTRVARRRRALARWAAVVPFVLLGGIFVGVSAGAAQTGASVTTGRASSVTSSSAVLTGSWELAGSGPVSLAFDYGTFPSALNSHVSVGTESADSGTVPPTEISGLAPGTTYYFELVGMTGSGSLAGSVGTFTTSPGGPPDTTTTTPTTTTPTTTTPTATPTTTPTTTSPTTTTTPPPRGTASPQQQAPAGSGSQPEPVPVIPPTGTPDGNGYWVAAANGAVYAFGDAQSYGSVIMPSSPVIGLASAPDGAGYWVALANGEVFGFGDVQAYGSATMSSSPAVAIAPTPDGGGYWVLASDGSVFAFGDAKALGPSAGTQLPVPAVGLAPTPDGQGYWVALANGSVLNFGDAADYGSAAGHLSVDNVVSIATTTDGQGYWLATAGGAVYTFGDAKGFGEAQRGAFGGPIVALTPTADGQGYWLVGKDGTVHPFGDAVFRGSLPSPAPTAAGLASTWIHPLADVPQQYVVLSQLAAHSCPGLPWEILLGIAKVESDFGRSTLPGVTSGTNPAGAAGPMQIGIGGAAGRTFFSYDHPVPADETATPVPPGADPQNPWDLTDALFAATRDLCTNGGGNPASLHSAILAYNHAEWYASEVETLAAEYAGASTYRSVPSPAVATAIRLALSQVGTPYTWGGTSPQEGFDCSGLVQWAYAQAGIALPRTSEMQWAAMPHVPPGAPLQAGDLVFFEPAPDGPGHVGIYLGDNLMVDAPHTGATVRVESDQWSSYVGAAIP